MDNNRRKGKAARVEMGVSILLISLVGFFCLCQSTQAASSIAEKIIEEAKKEGEVAFHTSMAIEEAHAVISRFEERYPFLKVKLTRTGSEGIATRIIMEHRAKKYGDVLQTVEFSMYTFRKMGILGLYIPAEDRFYPKEFKEQGYWTCSYNQPYVAVYNTKLVPQDNLPKTYEDLLKPRWKKKMAMEGTKVDWFAGMLQIMGREKGMKFMRDLSSQDITKRTGHSLIASLVAAGEAELDINIPSQVVEQIRHKGAPIDWLALGPVPGVMVGIGMTAQAPHPNAAKLFVDFMLSHEVQTVLKDRFFKAVARSDVPQSAKYAELRVIPVNPSLADNINEYAKLLRETFSK